MRKLITGVLTAALALSLMAAEPADAKVYKMKPEERAAALKDKKAKKAHAKKSKKAAEEANGGWVEVKGGKAVGEKKSKKSSKVDEIAKAAETKEKKSKKSKKDKSLEASEVKEPKAAKTTKLSKAEKRKNKNRNVSTRDAFRDSGREGSKVRASSAEVRRPGGAAGPAGQNLDAYSVSRPGYEKGAAPAAAGAAGAPAAGVAPAIPEVRHEVQPGPLDSSKPLGTEAPKGGEGRF